MPSIKSRRTSPTGDERHNKRRSGPPADSPQREPARRPVGTISSASDGHRQPRIETASLKAGAPGPVFGVLARITQGGGTGNGDPLSSAARVNAMHLGDAAVRKTASPLTAARHTCRGSVAIRRAEHGRSARGPALSGGRGVPHRGRQMQAFAGAFGWSPRGAVESPEDACGREPSGHRGNAARAVLLSSPPVRDARDAPATGNA
jgi:hypothetical protein